MCRLIESIKLLDGRFHNLPYHERRMEHSLRSLFSKTAPVGLERLLKEMDYPTAGLYKCRIVYAADFLEVTFTPYVARVVRSVKVVEDDGIDYAFKFEDRHAINRLFELRGECDDVMIIKMGRVTDCSYSNIVFRKGRRWYTPALPLLQGTMRERMLEGGKIEPREIRKGDLRSFDSFRIVNAMLEFDAPEIDVSDIVF